MATLNNTSDKSKFARGDILVRKRWWGYQKRIVNRVFEIEGRTKLLLGTYLRTEDHNMLAHTSVYDAAGWQKI